MGHPIVYPEPLAGVGHPIVYPEPLASVGHPIVYPEPLASVRHPIVYPESLAGMGHPMGHPIVYPESLAGMGHPIVNPEPLASVGHTIGLHIVCCLTVCIRWRSPKVRHVILTLTWLLATIRYSEVYVNPKGQAHRALSWVQYRHTAVLMAWKIEAIYEN